MEFIYLFLFRVISGLQNGLGYARAHTWRTAVSYLLVITAFLPVLVILPGKPTVLILIGAIAGAIISALGAYGVEDSFNEKVKRLPKDIHLWEMLATGGVVISVTIMGGNIILILASIYPALIIHKGLINTFSGFSWWYHGTDDVTGKTFTIPLLGLSVPRLNVSARKTIAVLSIVAAAVAWIVPLRYNIYDIFVLLF